MSAVVTTLQPRGGFGPISQGAAPPGCGGPGVSCHLGQTAQPLGKQCRAPSPEYKSKRGGFLHKLFSNPGRENNQRRGNSSLGRGVHRVVSPQSPRTLPAGLRRRERGTGKAGRVEQREPRLGPADHSPGRRSRRAFAQEAPPARLLGALLCGGGLGSGLAALLCTRCTPGRGQPWGKPPSHPRGRSRGRPPLVLGW